MVCRLPWRLRISYFKISSINCRQKQTNCRWIYYNFIGRSLGRRKRNRHLLCFFLKSKLLPTHTTPDVYCQFHEETTFLLFFRAVVFGICVIPVFSHFPTSACVSACMWQKPCSPARATACNGTFKDAPKKIEEPKSSRHGRCHPIIYDLCAQDSSTCSGDGPGWVWVKRKPYTEWKNKIIIKMVLYTFAFTINKS